jgi:hypothetical protein
MEMNQTIQTLTGRYLMKRILVLALLAVLVLSLSAFAAEAGKKMPMAAGIKAGISLANATGSDATITGGDKKMKLGLGFGGFFAFTPMKSFTIQPEVLYVQKGVKYNETGGSEKLTYKVDYLEVPVLFKFTPEMQNSKIAPTLFAGPFLGFLMTAKEKLEGAADPADNYDDDVKDYMKSTEFGITFGGGLGYKMAKGELFFDARYDLGLSKIQKAEPEGYQSNVKNSAILVLVGYKFNI